MIDEHHPGAASLSPAPRRRLSGDAARLFALLFTIQGTSIAVAAQPLRATQGNATGAPQVQQRYTLRVTKEPITSVSLTADGAGLPEIAIDLARRVGTRVIVGPAMANETISVTFSELPLEAALASLAPRVYIDYEIRQGAQPTPQAIYLLGGADREPARNATVPGASQGVLITGNTEDTEKPPADDPLQVRYYRNRLTVIAKQQPLATVVTAIAEVMNLPSDIRYDGPEIVDTDIRESSPEEAILGLSRNIRLYVRTEVQGVDRTLLRLVLLPPGGK